MPSEPSNIFANTAVASPLFRKLEDIRNNYQEPGGRRVTLESRLAAAGQLSGNLLFRFHVTRELLAAGTCSDLAGAEFQAVTRWAALSKKQVQYWEGKANELDKAHGRALKEETYSDFMAGKLTPRKRTKVSSEAQTESSLNNGLSIAPSTASSGRGKITILKRQTDPPPGTQEAHQPLHADVSLEPQQEVNEHQPDPTLAHGEPHAASCTGTVHDTQCAVDQRPSPVASSPPDAEESQPTVERISNMSIDELVLHIRGQPFTYTTKQSYFTLADKLLESGQSLFYFHATVILPGKGAGEAPDLTVDEVWNCMNIATRGIWSQKTEALYNALRAGKGKGLQCLSNQDRAIRHAMTMHVAARKTLKQDLKATSTSPSSTALEREVMSEADIAALLASESPILDLLCGAPASNVQPDEAVAKILASIDKLVQQNAGLELEGRHKSMRISYSNSYDNVTSITRRLPTALQTHPPKLQSGIEGQPVKWTPRLTQEFESLLRPLIVWNEHAFPALQNAKLNGVKPELVGYRGYRSSLESLQKQLKELQPLTSDKKEEVVVTLMEELRRRVQAIDPYADCLLDSTAFEHAGVQKWSLYDNTHGFATSIAACFEREDLSSEEYEDLLEQALSRLGSRAPVLFLLPWAKELGITDSEAVRADSATEV